MTYMLCLYILFPSIIDLRGDIMKKVLFVLFLFICIISINIHDNKIENIAHAQVSDKLDFDDDDMPEFVNF